MPAIKITRESFKVIAQWHPKIGVAFCIIQHLEFAEDPVANIRWKLLGKNVFEKEIPEPVIAPTLDHAASLQMYHRTVQRLTALQLAPLLLLRR